jgi:urease accessory protein
MLIKQKLGNLSSVVSGRRNIDWLRLEWHECNKRILHKRTESGKEVTLKFLGEAQGLQQDDILFSGDDGLIAVDILLCEVIVLKPATLYEMALVCYEIGNKHLPLFYEGDCLLMPYDAPTHRMLQASGFAPEVQKRKLLQQLRTTVSPHGHTGGESLFSKILKLTTPANE